MSGIDAPVFQSVRPVRVAKVQSSKKPESDWARMKIAGVGASLEVVITKAQAVELSPHVDKDVVVALEIIPKAFGEGADVRLKSFKVPDAAAAASRSQA